MKIIHKWNYYFRWRFFDRYNIICTKTQVEMNDIIINLYINHTQHFGKQIKSYVVHRLQNWIEFGNCIVQLCKQWGDCSLYYFLSSEGCFLALSNNEKLLSLEGILFYWIIPVPFWDDPKFPFSDFPGLSSKLSYQVGRAKRYAEPLIIAMNISS